MQFWNERRSPLGHCYRETSVSSQPVPQYRTQKDFDDAQQVHADFCTAQVRCYRFEQRELYGCCLGRAKSRLRKRRSGVDDVDVDSIPSETLLFVDSRLWTWLRRPEMISYIVLACVRVEDQRVEDHHDAGVGE